MAKSKKERGLGRGLDALFAEQAAVIKPEPIADKYDNGNDENQVIYISIDDIKPNRDQPRKRFDNDKIDELAESIETHGIIQPLIVRKSGKFYELVAGERRWRASRKAKLKQVPCLVRQFTDEENVLVAIIENMQRENLNPIEEAEGLEQMIKTYGMTQEQVSKSVGKSRPYISNALRLLKLPDNIKRDVSIGRLTSGHGRALAGLADREKQDRLAKRVVEQDLSVRELERLLSDSNKHRPRKQSVRKVKDADTLRVENELKERFGTKISINRKGNKGSIELEFYSDDDLNRLIDLLRGNK